MGVLLIDKPGGAWYYDVVAVDFPSIVYILFGRHSSLRWRVPFTVSAHGRRVGDGVSPAGGRRGVSYNLQFRCKFFSSSYTFSVSTGENMLFRTGDYTPADIMK